MSPGVPPIRAGAGPALQQQGAPVPTGSSVMTVLKGPSSRGSRRLGSEGMMAAVACWSSVASGDAKVRGGPPPWTGPKAHLYVKGDLACKPAKAPSGKRVRLTVAWAGGGGVTLGEGMP